MVVFCSLFVTCLLSRSKNQNDHNCDELVCMNFSEHYCSQRYVQYNLHRNHGAGLFCGESRTNQSE